MADFNFSTLFTANDKKFQSSIKSMKTSLSGLNKTFKSGERDTTKYFSSLKRHDQLFSKMSKDANRASNSINNVGKSFKGLNVILGASSLYLVTRMIGQAIEATNDMVETANLFSVAMGDMAVASDEFLQSFSEITGLDITNLRESVGTYSLLARSMGFANDQAQVLAENTAKLALDLSSLTNVPIQQVMKDLRSGLVGQSETVYKYGIDVTEASLQTEAMAQGITKSVRTMSQGEKMALRYAVMIRQTGLAQGDFAKTIETPANQLRILRERFVTASRSIGSIFVPALAMVLPYANALLIVITDLADALAKLFGYEAPEIENTLGNIGGAGDDITDSLDDANDSASKLKSTLLGFDEINLLPDQTSSSSGATDDSTGGFDVGLEGYDNGLNTIVSTTDEIVESVKEALTAFSELFSGVDPTNLLTSLENLGIALEPYGEAGAKTFDFFINEILVPLTEWTVNEALPTGIDAITSAFSALSPLLQPLGDGLLSLWENYLGPAVSGVGDGIITGLEDVIEFFGTMDTENSTLADSFENLTTDFEEYYDLHIAPTVDTWKDKFKELQDSFTGISDAYNDMKDALGITNEEIDTEFGKFIEGQRIFGMFFIQLIGAVVMTVITLFLDMVQTLIELFTGFWVLGEGIIEFSGPKLIEGFGRILEAIANLLLDMGRFVVNTVIDIINAVITAYKKVMTLMNKDTSGISTIKPFDYSIDINWNGNKSNSGFDTYDPGLQYRNASGLANQNTIASILQQYNSGAGVDLSSVFGLPASGTEPIDYLAQNQQLADLIGVKFYEALANIEADREFGQTGNQEVILQLDGTELGRALLPKMDRESQRQGYEPILQTK